MNIKSYADCVAMFATRERKLARNTYLESFETAGEVAKGVDVARPTFAVKLHQTRIVTYYADGRIQLDSGGWRTVTTKERINTFSPIQVWQDLGIWYARDTRAEREGHGEQCVFADDITFHFDGRVTGKGDDPKKELKLRRAVRAYATALVDKTLAGELGPPSGGDCWFCCMQTDKGKSLGDSTHDTSHLRAHLREKYYVPSLLQNAVLEDRSHASPAARSVLGCAWRGEREHVDAWRHVARPQLVAAVANYIFHRLSMTPTRAIYHRR